MEKRMLERQARGAAGRLAGMAPGAVVAPIDGPVAGRPNAAPRESRVAARAMALMLGTLVPLGPATATVRGGGEGADLEPFTGAPPAVLESRHPLVQRFLARPDEPVRRFRVRRRMRCAGIGREAGMEVLVELDPEAGFRWRVLSEEGSRIMRDRGFRAMLEKEGEAYATGEVSRSSLTGDNYHLTVDGLEPDGLVRLRARPRRREKTLIDGTFSLTPDDADLVRVEGRLARGPSFWVPRVEVVRRYERVRGHRVMVRMESTASIRFFGQVRMVADYQYEMIDGEVISGAPPPPIDPPGPAFPALLLPTPLPLRPPEPGGETSVALAGTSPPAKASPDRQGRDREGK